VTTEGPLSEISGPYFDRSNQLLQPIVAVAVLAASAGGLPPVVSITGAGRFQEPPAPPTALGVVVSSDEFQPT